MPRPPSPARVVRWAVPPFCAALAALSCSPTASSLKPAHPALLAADLNRDRLVAHVVIPSLDRTLATVEAMRGDGAFPFGANELRQMIQARVNLPAELLDLADTAKPLAAALVKAPPLATVAGAPASAAGANHAEAPPLVAGVASVKSLGALAEKARAAGNPAETRKDAQRFVRPDGSTLWVAHLGDRVIWSDSFEGLSEAGSHALAAPAEAGTDDVIATIFPASFVKAPAVAPAAGRTAGDAAAQAKRDALSGYDANLRARGQAPNAAERAAVGAALDFVLPSLAESERVRIGLGITRARGIGLAVRATPRAGSDYAKRLAPRTPYQVPMAFISPASTVSVLASGANPSWAGLLQAVLDAQTKAAVPGAAAVAARTRALLPLLSGETFHSVRAEGSGLAIDHVIALGSMVDPAAARAAVAALFSEPALPILLQQAWGQKTPQIEALQQSDRLLVTLTFPAGGGAPGPATLARAVAQSERLTLIVQAAAGRLVISSEPGAEGRQRALIAALATAPAAPAGSATAAAPVPLTEALLESARREGLLYLELWGVARPVLRAAMTGAQRGLLDMVLSMPGLDTMILPMWISVAGGEALTTELRVPVATLKNAVSLLGLLGGAGLAPAAAQP